MAGPIPGVDRIVAALETMAGTGVPGPGAYTNLTISGLLTCSGSAPTGAGITALFASPPAIGGTARAAVSGTTGNFNGAFVASAGSQFNGGSANAALAIGASNGVGGLAVQGTTGIGGYTANACFIDNTGSGTTRLQACGVDNSTIGFLDIYTGVANFSTNVKVLRLTAASSKSNVIGLWPTSAAGLATGTLWNNAGVINVA